MAWNPKYALLLALSTTITFLSGILINYSNGLTDEKKKNFQKKLWCFLSFSLNLAILFFFKYFDFAVENINFFLSHFKLQTSSHQTFLRCRLARRHFFLYFSGAQLYNGHLSR
jgi:hypothetical protein